MLGIKIIIYSAIFLISSSIGLIKSRKYAYRAEELREFKSALNIFKTKIKFTYEPIPDIFNQISESIDPVIGGIFKIASKQMAFCPAGDAWTKAMETDILNINSEDINILKNLSKMLGNTDVDGQISQIELTSTFLDEQIEKAEKEKQRNEAMYRKLGAIIGLGIVIILL